jgi:cytochrome c oxidase assembly protein subunit 15
MNAQPLFDLTPLVSLLVLGALLAVGPVAWVHWRNRHTAPSQRLQALRLLTLFLTFDLIVFGAFTRLTDSGLGCPDWPGCYGNTSPVGAHQAISAAQKAMPTGPVTPVKAWIEMIHRYLATGVGALIVAILVMNWHDWRERRRTKRFADSSPWLALVTLVWVGMQGAFGALTVTMKLFPAIVTLHLAGALVLLVLLSVQVVRGGATSQRWSLPNTTRLWLAVGCVVLVLQIFLGAWVSTNYAVLACSDFPLCQGRWWPEMNFTQGFELWRHLGVTGSGEPINFAALTAIHYVHRLVAYLVIFSLTGLAWQLSHLTSWRAHSRVLAGLVALQLVTGLANVVLDWPLLAALLHTAGAAALVSVLTAIASRDWSSQPRPVVGILT